MRPVLVPALSFALALSLLTADAKAATVGINGLPCAYATLQAAVNAAAPGDTLWVEADGVMNVESTLITKDDLTIRASEPGTNCGSASVGGANAMFQADPGFATLIIAAEGTIDYLKLVDITLTGGNGWRAGNIDAVDGDDNFTLLLFSSAIVNGDSQKHGGGVNVGAQHSLIYAYDTVFLNNRAAFDGGAIYSREWDSKVLLEGTTQVSLSRADGLGGVSEGGGAINTVELEMRGDAQIANAQALNADDGGGCINVTRATLHDNSSIVDCDTNGQGGAVFASDFIEMLNSSEVREGNAQGNGGLISSGEVILRDDALLQDGVSQGNGGLVFLDSWPHLSPARLEAYATTGTILLRGGRAFDGAGVYAPVEGGQAPEIVLADGVEIRGNEATGFGGGLFVGGGTLTVTGNVIIGDTDTQTPERNVAMSGAGIYAEGGAVVTLGTPTIGKDADAWRLDPTDLQPFHDYGVHITQNNATHSGAGIELSGATLYGYQPAIYDNRAVGSSAGGDGGGIAAVAGSTVVMQEFHIAHNRAWRHGGGVYANDSDVYLTFPQNDATCYVEQDLQANRYCNELQYNEAGRPMVATTGEGGAIYASSGSYVELGTVGLRENGAHVGGAHLLVDGSSHVLVERSIFADTSPQWNSTQGVLVEAGGDLVANLNTFAGRGATVDIQSGATGIMEFNVIWPDGNPGAGLVLGGTFSGGCNVGDGVLALYGYDNVDADPDFVTVTRGDYRVPTTSVVNNHCFTLPLNSYAGIYAEAEVVRDLDGLYIDPATEYVDPGAFETP